MITVQKPNTVKSSGVQASVSFGIKQEGLAHIFNVLRNQLYSDKILAVIREYSCNAVDANVEAGCPATPITVSLPNRLEPMFKVRDNGLGLSDKDIQEIYAFYGESTKRNSNALIGQLGLGSKSAFAYGDNYVINSFVDGVKTSYNAFIDVSQIGQISKLFSVATTEPNGVEIVIPVKDKDIESFKTKAKELFQHFKVRPTILGQTLEYSKKEVIFSGSFWKIEKEESYYQVAPVAIMGNIGYEINISALDENVGNAFSGLNMYFNIGDLEVSASRESLQYTERTKKALLARFKIVIDDIKEQINTLIDNCSTFIEAKRLYNSLNDYHGNYYRFNSLLKGSIAYKGVAVTDCDVMFGDNRWTPMKGVVVQLCRKSRRPSSNNFSKKNTASGTVSSNSVFVLNDNNTRSGINKLVYDLVFGKKTVYILNFDCDASKQAWMKREGFVDADFVKMSSLKPTTAQNPSASSGVSAPKNSKHSSQAFIYSNSNKYFNSTCSTYWNNATVDLAKDSGVYVEIEGFKIKGINGFNHPSELERFKTLAELGFTMPTIYGFKKGVVEKVAKSKNWKTFEAYVQEQVEAHLAKKNMSQLVANKIEQREVTGTSRVEWGKFVAKSSKSKSVFNTFIAAFAECSAGGGVIDSLIEKMERYLIKPTLPAPTHNLIKMRDEVLAKYPMLSFISFLDAVSKEKALAYVAVIDKTS